MAMQVIRLQGFIGASSIFPPFVPATNGPTAFSPQVKTIVNRLINYRISIRRPATVQCHRRLSTDAAPSSNHGQGQKSADHYAVIVIFSRPAPSPLTQNRTSSDTLPCALFQVNYPNSACVILGAPIRTHNINTHTSHAQTFPFFERTFLCFYNRPAFNRLSAATAAAAAVVFFCYFSFCGPAIKLYVFHCCPYMNQMENFREPGGVFLHIIAMFQPIPLPAHGPALPFSSAAPNEAIHLGLW